MEEKPYTSSFQFQHRIQIPEALEDLLGAKGLSDFESEVEKNLKSNREASHTLFKNWCGIVFH
jgi:hypothetical protein